MMGSDSGSNSAPRLIPSFLYVGPRHGVAAFCRDATGDTSLLAEEKADGRPHLSASRLLERRKEFNRNLVNIVKQHHKVRPPGTLRFWGLRLLQSLSREAGGRSGLASGLKDIAGSCGVLLAGVGGEDGSWNLSWL